MLSPCTPTELFVKPGPHPLTMDDEEVDLISRGNRDAHVEIDS